MHPQVVATPEMPFYLFFRNACGTHAPIGKRSNWVYRYLQLMLERTPVESAALLGNRKLSELLPSPHHSLPQADMTLQTGLLNPEGKNPTHVVYKHSVNTLFTDRLASDFPNARFIHLVRHPAGVALSRVKNQHLKPSKPALSIARWKRYHTQCLKVENRYPDRVMRIRFEDLVAETEATLKTLCRFLDLDWKEDMLHPESSRYFNVDLTGSDDRYRQTRYSALSHPIDPSKALGWQKADALPMRLQAESHCGALLEAFGYDIGQQGAPKTGVAYRVRLRSKVEVVKLKITYYLPIRVKLQLLERRVRKIASSRQG
jgi:hypothetical protein